MYTIVTALAFTPRDVRSHRGFVSKTDMIRVTLSTPFTLTASY